MGRPPLDPPPFRRNYEYMSKRSSKLLTPERCEIECVHPEHVAPLLGRVIDLAAADVVASTFGLLADPTRARILHSLALADELCVCDLALLLGMTQSALSHQLRLLRVNGVVGRRKIGRMVYYRLADRHIRKMLSQGLRHAEEDAQRPSRAAG